MSRSSIFELLQEHECLYLGFSKNESTNMISILKNAALEDGRVFVLGPVAGNCAVEKSGFMRFGKFKSIYLKNIFNAQDFEIERVEKELLGGFSIAIKMELLLILVRIAKHIGVITNSRVGRGSLAGKLAVKVRPKFLLFFDYCSWSCRVYFGGALDIGLRSEIHRAWADNTNNQTNK